MHIALFGGSFDPPHIGHVLCACYAFVHGGVDRVWVLPVAEHPYGKQLADWDTRWELCQAAFRGLDFVEVRGDERDNPGGRTVTLVERLRDVHRDDRFALIGGTDAERDIRNWHRGDDLAALVRMIPVPRRGYDDDHPAALPAISSTAVRARIAQQQSVAELLPPRVHELIAARGLYAHREA